MQGIVADSLSAAISLPFAKGGLEGMLICPPRVMESAATIVVKRDYISNKKPHIIRCRA